MQKATFVFLLMGLFALGGCTSNEVAGQYEATTFRVRSGADTVDVLSKGGAVNITLHEDSTVEGRVFGPKEVPALSEKNEDIDVQFGGTYSVTGNKVTFDHDADTFVGNTVWTFKNGTLQTDYLHALFVELEKK